MKDKVIITAALTGGATPKELNENLPMTPEEIAEDAYRCWKAGAAVVHLHMRNEDGSGSADPEKFRRTIELIRSHEDCDVIINCTNIAHLGPDLTTEQRLAPFREVPGIEMGSFDAGTINWGCSASFSNPPALLDDLSRLYQEKGIVPEQEIFDTGMIGNCEYYAKKGQLPTPMYFQFVLGVLGGGPATVENLTHLVHMLPEGSLWSAFGIGKSHLPIMYTALALGADGIRVGLEDNVMYSRDVKATNLMLVERAVRVVREFNKEPATPAETREILGIRPLVR
ncbi:MAG: 3-keto-5-aminohexanoate cleavage protein [Emergencia sp.]